MNQYLYLYKFHCERSCTVHPRIYEVYRLTLICHPYLSPSNFKVQISKIIKFVWKFLPKYIAALAYRQILPHSRVGGITRVYCLSRYFFCLCFNDFLIKFWNFVFSVLLLFYMQGNEQWKNNDNSLGKYLCCISSLEWPQMT